MTGPNTTNVSSEGDSTGLIYNSSKGGDFGLDIETIKKMIIDKDTDKVSSLGGPSGLAAALKSSTEDGLHSDSVPLHRQVFGENRLPERKLKPFFAHLFEALQDPILIALIIASIITIIFGAVVSKETGDWIEGVAIMVAVAIVSGVGSVQNYQQEKQFESLSKVKADRQVLVIRDGKESSISIYDVVVGDVFVIKQGEVLPVDGYFLQGNGIKCDESAMTGEPIEIPKHKEAPFLVSGAQVTAGAGTMLVLTSGVNTSYGQIVKDLETAEPPPTPLQEKLEHMAKLIGIFGITAGVLILLVLLISYLATNCCEYDDAFEEILSFFIIGITIIIVAVPEGLPLAVTLTLAYSMKKMIKDNVLVRELNACETMGSASCICSDKTGTLTENRMTVVKGWFFGTFYNNVPTLEQIGGPSNRDALARAIALNSDAGVRYETRETGGTKIHFDGNKTEGGLLHMLRSDFDLDFAHIRKTAGPLLVRENFDSSRKRMSTVYAPGSGATSNAPLTLVSQGALIAADSDATTKLTQLPGGDNYVVYTKGASEIVLGLCSHYLSATGEKVALTDASRADILRYIESMASQGLRTLSIASRVLNNEDVPKVKPEDGLLFDETWEHAFAGNTIESNLTLLCVAGIKDPVRPAVPLAVAKCKSAGIKVRMVTGDNLLTARFIAEECGIYTGGICLEGKEWREMTDQQREEAVVKMEVLARAIPSDKLILVETLKKLGETVAVTGDGTNDAPALRAAHVGCAMGIAGTEVAKEAGKMIILDDNFASIVVAVVWGRSVLENIRKFLVFQLTINLSAGLLTMICAIIHAAGVDADYPLAAIHLLWINLIMDSFAALMLATEPPDAELMKMKPQGRDTSLLTKTMTKYVVGQSIFQLALLLPFTLADKCVEMYQMDPADKGSKEHYTAVFNTFVWLQLFNLFNSRRIHDQWDLLKNYSKSAIGVSMVILIIALQIILVEYGSDAFKTAKLTVEQHFICIGLGALSIPVGYILRLIPIRDAITFNPHYDAPSTTATTISIQN